VAEPTALEALAQGVWGWLRPEGGLGHTNSGVIVGDDAIVVVDCQMTPAQAAPFATAVADLGPPVRHVVLTSSHIEFVGGNQVFRMAAVYGSEVTSAFLDQAPNVAAYQAFFPDHADDFSELTTRPVSHVIAEPVMLTPAVEIIPMMGSTQGDLVVNVPAAAVLFAGGMCSFGTTPLAFQAYPAEWYESLDLLERLAADGTQIVPGHGPVGGVEDVRALRAYLAAVVDAEGDPTAIPDGPWDGWSHRELDEINVERAHLLRMGDDSLPPTMARAIGFG
jgi:glyoxylase-like metal-dependent hydrolase (beta-lactamase superfamily II)